MYILKKRERERWGSLLKNVCGPSMVSSYIRKSLCINYVLMALLYSSETWTLYKHQLKLREGFHQRCLRQIFHIKWQSHISDTEVLGKAELSSIQSMVMKCCLGWVGHIVPMDDGRLPRQLFHGEMWEGKRSALKPKKRFNDTIKYYLKQSGLAVDQWEKWLQIEVSGGN